MDQEVEKIIDHIEKGENFSLAVVLEAERLILWYRSYVRLLHDIRQVK